MENKLKIIRQALRLNQTQLATALGVSLPSVTRYESDYTLLTDRVQALIEKKLNVSRQWLETGEGEMFVNGSVPELSQNSQNLQISPSTPWKEEAYTLLKEQLQQSERRYNELMTMFSTFMGKSKSFLKAPQMPLVSGMYLPGTNWGASRTA